MVDTWQLDVRQYGALCPQYAHPLDLGTANSLLEDRIGLCRT